MKYGLLYAAIAAGIVNGVFGAGGGMVLVPLLTLLTDLKEESVFPVSISLILPICITTLITIALSEEVPWLTALPYMLGSILGGIISGIWGAKIPVIWLHRGLGILILWGGIRYLC